MVIENTTIKPIPYKTAREVIEKIEQDKDTLEFMSTGFRYLDQHLDGGFMRQELVVIGSRTGSGKSVVAGQLFHNIARQGFKSAYFSLEISNEMIMSRLIGSIANIKPTRIRTGLITPAEFEEKTKAKADIEILGDNVSFYDNTYELEDIIREIKEREYEFTVIDFIQNIFTKDPDEYTRLSRISLELQKLAKEIDGTILVLSQLSNAVAREGMTKSIEYRGSGSIATVCDLGFFIEREEEEWTPQTALVDNLLTLNLRKNRRGAAGVGFQLYYRQPGGLIYEKSV